MKTMVSKSELDVTDTAQTPETLDLMVEKEALGESAQWQETSTSSLNNQWLLQTTYSRRAMAYALDYDAVNNDIYGSIKPTGPR